MLDDGSSSAISRLSRSWSSKLSPRFRSRLFGPLGFAIVFQRLLLIQRVACCLLVLVLAQSTIATLALLSQ
jgi:hypothetical protein